jgi:hypothetical protein
MSKTATNNPTAPQVVHRKKKSMSTRAAVVVACAGKIAV